LSSCAKEHFSGEAYVVVTGLSVTTGGSGVVPLAGSVALRLLADRVGLTDGLSAALCRRNFLPVHDRGQVWVDVATMLAAGGEAIADIDTLRHQSELLCAVASPPTVWRSLDEITPGALRRVEKTRPRFAAGCGACYRRCPPRRSPAQILAG
jgi:hypothetical protein